MGRSIAPVANAHVEIWRCDVGGNYSQYGTVANQTFPRGIQTTDSTGQVTFVTIYPGRYQGRATHLHIEATVNWRLHRVVSTGRCRVTDHVHLIFEGRIGSFRCRRPRAPLQERAH